MNKPNIEMIISDVDDTIFSGGYVCPKGLEDQAAAIRKAQDAGVIVSLATGRVEQFAKPVIKALGIVDLCVIANGAAMYDPITDTVTRRGQPIAPRDYDGIRKYISSYGSELIVPNDSKDECGVWNAFVPALPASMQATMTGYLDKYDELDYYIAGPWHTHANPALHEVSISIAHTNSTKASAVNELIATHGVMPDTVVGIGDGHNDVGLFEAVGTSLAVANAHDALLQMADTVVAHVDEGGFCQAVDLALST